MPYMVVRHKVQNFARWKQVFDEHGGARKSGGSRGGQLFRSADDPNEVMVLLECDSLENARRFVNSEDLGKTKERAGVADRPDIYFVDEVDKPSA